SPSIIIEGIVVKLLISAIIIYVYTTKIPVENIIIDRNITTPADKQTRVTARIPIIIDFIIADNVVISRSISRRGKIATVDSNTIPPIVVNLVAVNEVVVSNVYIEAI